MREDEVGRRASSRYRKIEIRMWGDERFCRLSAIQPSGQALWLYLLTGPHTGPIPGLFKAGRAGMAEELGWDQEAFDEAFAEVFREGLVKADFKARLMWIPNAIKFNSPTSPNVVLSWATELDLLPECELKAEALASLKASVFNMGEAFGKAFDKASGKPSPKPSPNQEQEQEQKQEEKKDAAPPPAGGVARRPPAKPKSSPRSSVAGGSKPPGGRRVVDPPPTAEQVAAAEAVLADEQASDEDRFFALKPILVARGVRWSMALMIASEHDNDFSAAFRAVRKALGTKDPISYLGGVAKNRRDESEAFNPPKAKTNGVPGWVATCRADGEHIQADGPNRWLWRGCTYDDQQNETGF